MTDQQKFPSGGNYPETEEDWTELLLRLADEASPEQLQKATDKWQKKGGKYQALARLFRREITVEQFDKEASKDKG